MSELLTQAQAKILAFQDDIRQLVDTCLKLKVENRDQAEEAASRLLEAKELHKNVETRRKEINTAPQTFIKAVNQTAKIATDPLEQAISHLTNQLNRFASLQEIERQKSVRQAQEEARKLQEQAGADVAVLPSAPLPTGPVRTATGTISQREIWRFQVVDLAHVPRDYLMVDEKRVRAAIDGGIRKIPGINIYAEKITIARKI